jgi:OOP family OmpA-OmpF porin
MDQHSLLLAAPDEYSSTNTGTKMKRTLRNLAILLALSSMSALVFAADNAPKKGYLTDSQNGVVKSNFGLCWHTGFWTPADAIEECDGGIAKPAAATPAPAPAPEPAAPVAAPVVVNEPAPEPAAPAAIVAPAPTAEKVTYSADAFFDFDKAVLKPEGKATLQNLVAKLKDTDIEVIVATGHTDWTGSDTYNMKLSMRRAKAVKAFLVSKGIPEARVFVEGKGESQPTADNHTKDGRAKNRRVDIEVVGTKK